MPLAPSVRPVRRVLLGDGCERFEDVGEVNAGESFSEERRESFAEAFCGVIFGAVEVADDEVAVFGSADFAGDGAGFEGGACVAVEGESDDVVT